MTSKFYSRYGHHFAHLVPALPVITALIIFALVVSACGSAPTKPSFTLGVIDYPASQVIENQTGGRSMQAINSSAKATYANVASAIAAGGARVPLSTYDKAISIKPDQWTIFINYVHGLERYITNHCGNPSP